MIPRLRGRSAAEYRDRIAQQARAFLEIAGLQERPALSTSINTWPRTPWPAFDRDLVRHLGDDERTGLLDRAERIVSGRFDLLGLAGLSYGSPVDWQLDPLSGRRAPVVHWRLVPYLDESRVGDHKVTWEVNRHQWLIHLGQAWLLSGDARYAETGARLVTEWLVANPPKRGINWCSSLEMAFRVQSWIHGLRLFRGSSAFTSELRHRMVVSAWVQLRHIECNLSTWFSPNTHLTGEALALLAGGTAWPDVPHAERWRALGWEILNRELNRQVRDDGVYFEQTAWYQAYTLDFYVQAAAWARAAGLTGAERIRGAIHSLARALRLVTRPDGTVVRLGDDDGGHALPYAISGDGDLTPSLWRAAVLCADGALMPPVVQGRSALIWLDGEPAIRAAMTIEVDTRARDSAALRSGGWVLLAEKGASPAADHWLVLDAGPHGAMSSPHSHADALAFDLSIRGRPIIVDPGTFTYVGSKRVHYRSTASHNTITVGHADSSEQKGSFSWASSADTRLIAFASEPAASWVCAAHDGYMRLPEPARHQRSVIRLAGRYWLVIDTLMAHGSVTVDQTLQMAETVDLRTSVGRLYEIASGPVRVCVALDPRLVGRVEASSVSPSYGLERPAPAIVAHGEVRRDASFCTVIADCDELVLSGLDRKSAEAKWEIRHDAGTDVVLRPGGAAVTLGEVTFNGEILIHAAQDGGDMLVAVGAGRLEVAGAIHTLSTESVCVLRRRVNTSWTLEG